VVPLTIAEQILAAHAVDGRIEPGAIATIRPDVVLLNDISGPLAFAQFAALALAAGHAATIDVAAGATHQGDRTWRFPPFQGEVAAILAAGGLAPHVRARLAATGR
jgi:hypothetical protein